MLIHEQIHTEMKGTIPVKPHLANFLRIKDGLNAPLQIPGKTTTEMYLETLLCNKTAVYDDTRQIIPAEYSAEVEFLISENRADRPNIFLSPTRIIRFNTFLHEYMHETLMQAIMFAFHHTGMTEKEVIYKFIEHYQLYAINFDSLKKASYRYRKRKNLDIFCDGKRPTVSGLPMRWKSTNKLFRNCPTVSGMKILVSL